MYKINWREQWLAALYFLVKTMGYYCARKIEMETMHKRVIILTVYNKNPRLYSQGFL